MSKKREVILWQLHCSSIRVSLFAHYPGVKRATVTPKCTYKEKRSMKALVARFVREDSGQDLIEYGLLVGIITSGAVLAINAIGPKVTTYFSTLETRLP